MSRPLPDQLPAVCCSRHRICRRLSASHTPGHAPERTFWEKATAIHVFCAQGSFRGSDRDARHWHDIMRLDAAGFADNAAKDRTLAHAVAEHKSISLAESMPNGAPIDYRAAVTGLPDLAPSGDAWKRQAEDYQRKVEDGLLLDDTEPFDVLLRRCHALAEHVNAVTCART